MKEKRRRYPTRGRGPMGREQGREGRRTGHGGRTEQRPATLCPGMIVNGIALCDKKPRLAPLAGGGQAKIDLVQMPEGCRHGDIVRAKIMRREGKQRYKAEVVQVIPAEDSALSRTRALAAGFGLRSAFDASALEEAERVSAEEIGMRPGREDYRGMETFTIDGADAKDFDDAVGIGDGPDGLTRLYVHIADVSHYVKAGTALDEEAFLRGTSVYFPSLVLPMLPEALCNGCCSLRPQEDRFTLSCVMDVDAQGTVRDYRITRGIIRSSRRFTYDEVNALLADPAALRSCPQGESLERLWTLARVLRRRRTARGCVDMDLPEPRIATDENGEVTDVTALERGESERLIEECMLLANETVARYVRAKKLDALYRIHEQPDEEKIDMLKRFAQRAGYGVKMIRRPVQSAMLSALFAQAKDDGVYPVLAALTMRSMQKARYDTAPKGHFALALEDYCHFTSPIRRYPDLFVHRAIGALLDGDANVQKWLRAHHEEAAQRTSACELTAMDAERAVDKMMMARWAKAHIGEEYEARITGVTRTGFFSALPNTVEGMTPVWALRDTFVLDEESLCLRGIHTGVRYTLGMRVSVRIQAVQEALGRIDLALADETQDAQ